MKNYTKKTNIGKEYELERKILIEESIIPQGVCDERVLNALQAVPRHYFVPPKYKRDAYLDITIPTNSGQVVSQPSIIGIMVQALGLIGSERILEIGTGTGYLTAILSLLAKEIYTIELLPQLSKLAERNLKKLGYTNIHLITGNGLRGLPSKAPFDCIISDAAIPNIPTRWINQLKKKGRIVAPIGKDIWHQKLIVGTKQNNTLCLQKLQSVQITPVLETKPLKLTNGVSIQQ